MSDFLKLSPNSEEKEELKHQNIQFEKQKLQLLRNHQRKKRQFKEQEWAMVIKFEERQKEIEMDKKKSRCLFDMKESLLPRRTGT